jgi:hypothetical protein
MAALSANRRNRRETWKRRAYKMATGTTCYQNGLAAYDQSAGKVVNVQTGASFTDLFILGTFYEKVANTSGADVDVVVDLKREINIVWLANDGTNPVTVNDIGKDVYGVDDQTASISSATSTRSIIGKAWAVDSTLGVAVELS